MASRSLQQLEIIRGSHRHTCRSQGGVGISVFYIGDAYAYGDIYDNRIDRLESKQVLSAEVATAQLPISGAVSVISFLRAHLVTDISICGFKPRRRLPKKDRLALNGDTSSRSDARQG